MSPSLPRLSLSFCPTSPAFEHFLALSLSCFLSHSLLSANFLPPLPSFFFLHRPVKSGKNSRVTGQQWRHSVTQVALLIAPLCPVRRIVPSWHGTAMWAAYFFLLLRVVLFFVKLYFLCNFLLCSDIFCIFCFYFFLFFFTDRQTHQHNSDSFRRDWKLWQLQWQQ